MTLDWRERGLSRMQYGICRRSKIAKKASGCNSIPGMMDIKRAEDVNRKVKSEDFNLDEMSTQAILTYADIEDFMTRSKVLGMIRHAVTNDTDPFTFKPLGIHGITEPMVHDMIELVTTGKVSPKPVPAVPLTKRDICMLDKMVAATLANGSSPEEKEYAKRLYKKIRGMPEKATA